MNDDTLTIEESRTLIKLCQAGRLYEIENWIASGKSFRTPPESKKSILSIAVTTEFHSLVELIARNEPDQTTKNQALALAISQHQFDLVKVLLDHGAELKSIPLIDALLSWEPKIIRLFLDNGADTVSGNPFAVAFRERIRTVLRPFVDYKQTHPELTDALQEQLDQALRYHANKGDLKWVSLLMWAGGNPRSHGWNIEYEDDPECYATALEEAASQENLAVLKRLKPDPGQDNIPSLLNHAAAGSYNETVKYLLDLGANPNDKANGSSTGIDKCLWHMRFVDIDAILHRHSRPTSKYVVSRTLECIRELVQRGAIWKPDNNSEMNQVRRVLYQIEPDVTLELLKMFVRCKACSPETINELLGPPRIKEHLISYEKELLKLGIDIRSKKRIKEIGEAKQAYISPYLLDRYDRQKLYEEVWSEPMWTLAKKYNLSDVGLAKVCTKLKVPRPARGYWEKKAAGKPVEKRPMLPSI